MRNDETIAMFRGAVYAAEGSIRTINDGSAEDGQEFKMDHGMVEGIAENLANWWDEKYPETAVTPETAREYLDEVYPAA